MTDTAESLTVEHLARLVGFDTVSAQSNLEMIGFLEDRLRDLGFRVTRLPDKSGEKAGLFAEIGPQGRGILLSGHTDVVPVEGQDWTRPPFRLSREGDRLYGRGTTDMKGFLAAMLSVAEQAARRDLKEPLKLVFSYDEEVGCVGIQQMADDLAPLLGRPRACIVGEPTAMQVAIGHKGKAAWRAVCRGQAGHSALAPNFVNALHLACDFVAELRALQERLKSDGARDAGYDIPYSTVHVGRMAGGIALNMVPESAELAFEFRHLAADPAERLAAAIRELAEAVAARYRPAFPGAAVQLERVTSYPGLDMAEADDAVALARAWAESDPVTKVAFGTEAGVFAGLGVPTVVCGPGVMEAQGHKPDEHVGLDQLAACDRMLGHVLDHLSA